MTNQNRLKTSKQQSFNLIQVLKNVIIKGSVAIIKVIPRKIALNNILSDKDNENSFNQALLIVSVFLFIYILGCKVLNYAFNG